MTLAANKVSKLEWAIVCTAVIGLLLVFFTSKAISIHINGISLLLIYGMAIICVQLLVFSTALFRYKDLAVQGKELTEFKKSALPKVSCMVSVHNEEVFVTNCLDSMFAQDYPNIEVIVVDDCSTDNTLAILENYRKKHQPKLKIITITKNVGKKAALCHAMESAKGTIYAHTDSDSIWQTDAISRIVRIFVNNPTIGAVSGHGRAQNASTNLVTKVQDVWMEGQFSIRKAFESTFKTVTCISGPLAVYRKEAVYNFLPAWRDDKFLGSEFRFATDRTLTAIVLGAPWLHKRLVSKYTDSPFTKRLYPVNEWGVVYSRSARSKTIVPDSFSKVFKQQIRWKKSFIRNTFFNIPFFWHKPLPVAVVYYAHILFVLAAPLVAGRVFLQYREHYFQVIIAYLLSVIIIGALFALVLRSHDKDCRYWYYRPLMSLFSAVCLSWIVIYSILTIKQMKWSRG